jgi:hypothetical protein
MGAMSAARVFGYQEALYLDLRTPMPRVVFGFERNSASRPMAMDERNHPMNVHDTVTVMFISVTAADMDQLTTFTCENAIGDYCYGRDNGGVAYHGIRSFPATRFYDPARLGSAANNSEITKARANLDRHLADALKIIPGDDWIVGQRVRSALEAGQYGSADRAVRTCQATRWWCEALSAYLSYWRHEQFASDSIAHAALSHMAPATRCAWNDVSFILRDALARNHYDAITCDERVAFEERLWWLSDPLYLSPGNERFVEQFARMVHLRLDVEYLDALISGARLPIQLLERQRNATRLSTAADEFRQQVGFMKSVTVPQAPPMIAEPGRTFSTPTLALAGLGIDEFMARAGIPDYFIQFVDTVVGHPLFWTYLGQFDPKQWRGQFLPTTHALLDPLNAVIDDWDPDALYPYEWAVANTEGPMHRLDFQLAYFQRGDSARMVAAVDVSLDTLLLTDPQNMVGGLAMTRAPSLPIDTLIQWNRSRWVKTPTVSRAPMLVSFEQLAGGRGSGRARFASAPPPTPTQRVGLSDVLLIDARAGANALPATLDEAASVAMGRTRLRATEPVGIFWEMYGLQPGDTVRYALSATPVRKGGIGGVVGRLFGGMSPQLHLLWSDPISAAGSIRGQAVGTSLTALEPGQYTLLLTATVPGQEPVSTKRVIEILHD